MSHLVSDHVRRWGKRTWSVWLLMPFHFSIKLLLQIETCIGKYVSLFGVLWIVRKSGFENAGVNKWIKVCSPEKCAVRDSQVPHEQGNRLWAIAELYDSSLGFCEVGEWLSLVSDQAHIIPVSLVTDQAVHFLCGGSRFSPGSDHFPDMRGKDVMPALKPLPLFYEKLDDKVVEDGVSVITGKTADGSRFERPDLAFPPDLGEQSRLVFGKMDTQFSLEEKLLLRYDFFCEKVKGEAMAGFVVIYHGRNTFEPPPVGINGPDPGPCLFTKTDTAESIDDAWIADRPVAGSEHLLPCDESGTRIPENHAVAKHLD